MRASSIILASLTAGVLAPLTASAVTEEEAHQSHEMILFDGSKKMFRGNSLEYSWPVNSPVYLKAVVDTDFEVRLNMLAEQQLDWNDTSFEQRWFGVPEGGVLTLVADLDINLSAGIDPSKIFSGLGSIPAFSYNLFDYDNVWEGEDEFDSALLPAVDGQPAPSSKVVIDPTDLYAIDYQFDPWQVAGDYGVEIEIWGDLKPLAEVELTGVKIRTGNQDLTAMEQVLTLNPPSTNAGTVTYESIWEATMNGLAGIVLTPKIEIYLCTDMNDTDNDGDLSCNTSVDFDYPYNIELDEDLANFKTKPKAYDVDVPAIRTSANAIDMGSVEILTTAEETITITMLGDYANDLIGAARLEGDAAFGIAKPDVLATASTTDEIVVTFSPQLSGSYTGTLVIETNDPIEPVINIPLSGTGNEPGVDDSGDTGGGIDSGDGSTIKGCGCSAAPAPGTYGMFGFGMLALLGLRRRR
jgi:MYXO-CTERM domain-containing protein